MDHSVAPVLDALADYRRLDRYGFTPPGHRQGRGADPRVLDVLGGALAYDVLATAGLDDRTSSNGYLEKAQELMADAVGAEHAFFSTCGSSLSVKASILAVTRGQGDILIGRDAHKSVVAGLVLSGLQPRWIPVRYDEELHLAHPPSPEAVEEMWHRYPDASAAMVTSPTPYGTCTDLAAIADICHSHGKPLIVDEAWGAHLPFHEALPTWAMDAGARRRAGRLTIVGAAAIVRHMPQFYSALDAVLRALADPTRRAVVERLAKSPAVVSELAAPFDMALPSFMQHLRILEAAGVVDSEKHGRVRTVSLRPGALDVLNLWLGEQRTPAERQADQLGVHLALTSTRSTSSKEN
jgi:DNA-binding transcriptional ArsR family regulator